MGSSSDDGTGLGLGTSAARLGAGTIARPARNLAVKNASLGVADAVFRSGTGVTAVLGRDVNSVSARLSTNTTTPGASGPGIPGVFAIDGAWVGVAVLLGRHRAAGSATELASSDHGLGAGLDAATTELGTGGPSSPARDSAVDWASERVARNGGREEGTHNATVLHICDNGTRLSLGTSGTRLGASTVARPA
jgi:hypothetical protein